MDRPPFKVSRIVHANESDLAAALSAAEADGYEPAGHAVGLPILVLPNGDLLVVFATTAKDAKPANPQVLPGEATT